MTALCPLTQREGLVEIASYLSAVEASPLSAVCQACRELSEDPAIGAVHIEQEKWHTDFEAFRANLAARLRAAGKKDCGAAPAVEALYCRRRVRSLRLAVALPELLQTWGIGGTRGGLGHDRLAALAPLLLFASSAAEAFAPGRHVTAVAGTAGGATASNAGAATGASTRGGPGAVAAAVAAAMAGTNSCSCSSGGARSRKPTRDRMTTHRKQTGRTVARSAVASGRSCCRERLRRPGPRRVLRFAKLVGTTTTAGKEQRQAVNRIRGGGGSRWMMRRRRRRRLV
mmetsp:Transcript_38289/g.121932  ORF Transcript_38289/g.121932 Transcript_38289/m.121932 type:complete len:285 (-) Transcript_38289:2285-3139(-)